MPFISVNGLTVPVLNTSPRKTYLEVGADADRTAAGASTAVGRRAIKRAWDVVAQHADGQSAEALESWVTGQGLFHVSFDTGVVGDFGLCPDRGYTGRCAFNGTLFGGQGYGFRTVNSTDVIRYRIPMRTRGNDWTAMGWFLVPFGLFWVHLAVVSRGGVLTRYANGVVTATVANISVDNPTTNAIRVSYLSATQAGLPASNITWDDVVMANFPMTAAMVLAVYNEGLAGRAHPAAPQVNVRGDVLKEAGPVVCRGVMQESDYHQGRQVGAAAWQNNLRTFAFRLEEV